IRTNLGTRGALTAIQSPTPSALASATIRTSSACAAGPESVRLASRQVLAGPLTICSRFTTSKPLAVCLPNSRYTPFGPASIPALAEPGDRGLQLLLGRDRVLRVRRVRRRGRTLRVRRVLRGWDVRAGGGLEHVAQRVGLDQHVVGQPAGVVGEAGDVVDAQA